MAVSSESTLSPGALRPNGLPSSPSAVTKAAPSRRARSASSLEPRSSQSSACAGSCRPEREGGGCMPSCARRSSSAACMPSCSESSAVSRAPDYVHTGPLLCDGRWSVERIAECEPVPYMSGRSTPCGTLHQRDRIGLECSRSAYPRSAIAKSAARFPPRCNGKCFQECREFRIRRYSRDARIFLAQLIHSDPQARLKKATELLGLHAPR